MVLAVPPYIAEVRFQYDPLRYTWDDWDLDRAESPVDESLLADLHYRLDADETMGDVVPREALDPEHSFDPANPQDLINDFLQRLCGSNNPFLCSYDEMSARGYKGPYCRFDQEYDRKLRFEW